MVQYHKKPKKGKLGKSTIPRTTLVSEKEQHTQNHNASKVPVQRTLEYDKAYEKVRETITAANLSAINILNIYINNMWNSSTPRNLDSKKEQNKENRNTSKILMPRTLEQEKSYEKVKQSMSAEKISELIKSHVNQLIGKCKDKLRRHKTRSLEGSEPILWMDEMMTVLVDLNS